MIHGMIHGMTHGMTHTMTRAMTHAKTRVHNQALVQSQNHAQTRTQVRDEITVFFVLRSALARKAPGLLPVTVKLPVPVAPSHLHDTTLRVAEDWVYQRPTYTG